MEAMTGRMPVGLAVMALPGRLIVGLGCAEPNDRGLAETVQNAAYRMNRKVLGGAGPPILVLYEHGWWFRTAQCRGGGAVTSALSLKFFAVAGAAALILSASTALACGAVVVCIQDPFRDQIPLPEGQGGRGCAVSLELTQEVEVAALRQEHLEFTLHCGSRECSAVAECSRSTAGDATRRPRARSVVVKRNREGRGDADRGAVGRKTQAATRGGILRAHNTRRDPAGGGSRRCVRY
ncbi:hypothetical protein EVAR_46319_1 [Eumeta japonica]|uniref:Uncharacterized protein n=1 Tax=Eumeta variegata TaxID=151549 RepID=A0A4C1WVT2_EUMVA|nr:hypothetical protein EVAR_46319_1 [Eumeta japonica]